MSAGENKAYSALEEETCLTNKQEAFLARYR